MKEYKYQVIATVTQTGRRSADVLINEGDNYKELKQWVNAQLTNGHIRYVKDAKADVWYNIESILLIEIRKATD